MIYKVMNRTISYGYRSQPAFDDFQNESNATRVITTWRCKHILRAWERSESQEDDQIGFRIPNFLNEGEKNRTCIPDY